MSNTQDKQAGNFHFFVLHIAPPRQNYDTQERAKGLQPRNLQSVIAVG